MIRADPPAPPASPPRAPLVLLGLLTMATLAGPFAIVLTVRGGGRAEWPPDRPVEWWTFCLVTAAVVVLLTACLTAGLWSRPTRPGERADSTEDR